MAGTATHPGAGARDLFVDAVRLGSVAVVIAYHWLATVPSLVAGSYHDVMLPTLVPALWPLTWTVDILPLFFLAGGYSNARSYRSGRSRGEGYGAFLRRRLTRLLGPTFVLLALWLGVDAVTAIFGGPVRSVASARNTAPFGVLWFVGVYLLQIVLTPVTLRVHERWGARAVAGMVVVAALTDTAAIVSGSGVPLLLNYVTVWGIPHQLGYLYADGHLRSLPRSRLLLVALGGLTALAALTSLPWYPRGLLDPRWQVGGVNMPTLPLVAQSFFIVALAVAAREPLTRWLRSGARRVRLVARGNAVIMTLFLGHTSAYLVAVLALRDVPGVMATGPTTGWWVARPLVVAASAAALAVLLAIRSAARARRGGSRRRATL